MGITLECKVYSTGSHSIPHKAGSAKLHVLLFGYTHFAFEFNRLMYTSQGLQNSIYSLQRICYSLLDSLKHPSARPFAGFDSALICFFGNDFAPLGRFISKSFVKRAGFICAVVAGPTIGVETQSREGYELPCDLQ